MTYDVDNRIFIVVEESVNAESIINVVIFNKVYTYEDLDLAHETLAEAKRLWLEELTDEQRENLVIQDDTKDSFIAFVKGTTIETEMYVVAKRLY